MTKKIALDLSLEELELLQAWYGMVECEYGSAEVDRDLNAKLETAIASLKADETLPK